MTMHGVSARAITLGLAASVCLVACGGGGAGNSTVSMSTPAATGYVVDNLVANSSSISAQHVDANLVNPWGVAFNLQGAAWVANAGTSMSTIYDGSGNVMDPTVTIPAGSSGSAKPTGMVFNATSDFVISSGGNSQPSMFIWDDLGGAILGWSPGVNQSSAVIAYDGGAQGASYTGLAMGTDSGGNTLLYATNVGSGAVDVFNATFAPVTSSGGFVNVNVPQGYSPFGIQNIPTSSGTTQLYVTYAQVDATTHRPVAGAGLGYLAVFDAEGNFIKELASGGVLNAPWGVALAPASGFGALSGMLLVGNFGDGSINAFNPSTGASAGPLMQNSSTVQIPGLWTIVFGNGFDSQPTTTLFFAAGPNNEAAGVYGRIDVAGSSTAPTSPSMGPY